MPHDPGAESTRAPGRLLFRVAVALAVLPIFVSAVRNGLDHWVPTWDAATTAIRVRDVFSSHPPLIGMASAASTWSHHQISFIGALELYLLAVPVKLLGVRWGVLLGMATINSAVLVTTAWLVRRRVGDVGGAVACAFLGSLVWAIGTQAPVDLTPMQIGVLPFVLLLVAAWSVADGDAPALLVLAIVGNYLLLDHLTFTLSAPAVGGFGLVLWVVHLRRARRDDPDGWAATRRSHLRWLGSGLAFTVLVWIPPLYQQLTVTPGNLTNLVKASSATPPKVPTLLQAVSAVVATVAVPRLWLRPTFRHPTFDPNGRGTPFLAATGYALLLLAIYALLWWAARRRGDRTIRLALATALFGVAALIATTKKSPSAYGLLANYLHSLWSVSVFVWMVVALALVRSWPALRTWGRGRGTAVAAVAVTACFAVLSYPITDLASGTPLWTVPYAHKLRPQVVAAARGKGPILVTWRDGPIGWAMWSNVMLDLQDAGVEFKVATIDDAQQFGRHRLFDQARPNARYSMVVTPNPVAMKGYTRVAAAKMPYDDEVHAWASRVTRVELQDRLPEKPEVATAFRKIMDDAVALSKREHTSLADNPFFIWMASTWADKGRHLPYVKTPGLDPGRLYTWARGRIERNEQSVYVYLAPISVVASQTGPLEQPGQGPPPGVPGTSIAPPTAPGR